jgi:cell shape-determining protein MreD
MKQALAIVFTVVALALDPIVDQAFGDAASSPDLRLAPLAICVSLCPGAPAVVYCGILGLILDCLAGPHLGARAVCFSLLAAAASIAVGRQANSWVRRIALWAVILFVAEIFSRVISLGPVGGMFQSRAVIDAALSTIATTILLSGLGLAVELLWRTPRSSFSSGRFAPAIGRGTGED